MPTRWPEHAVCVACSDVKNDGTQPPSPSPPLGQGVVGDEHSREAGAECHCQRQRNAVFQSKMEDA